MSKNSLIWKMSEPSEVHLGFCTANFIWLFWNHFPHLTEVWSIAAIWQLFSSSRYAVSTPYNTKSAPTSFDLLVWTHGCIRGNKMFMLADMLASDVSTLTCRHLNLWEIRNFEGIIARLTVLGQNSVRSEKCLEHNH